MVAANKAISSVQTAAVPAPEIKHWDFFDGDGHYPEMLPIAFDKQSTLRTYCVPHGRGGNGGTTERFEVLFLC